MSRPTVIDFNYVFSVQGEGRATRRDFPFAFVVERPSVTILDSSFSFAVEGVQPTLFYHDGTELVPGSQYVWTGTEWFPPL